MRKLTWFLVGLVIALASGLCCLDAHAQLPSCSFTWTAPGDDGNQGTATRYEMRWSNARPDTTTAATFTTWWTGATAVAGLPTPLVAGTSQGASFVPSGGLLAGRTYYFVLVAYDEVNNVSPFSNVAWVQVTDTVGPACPCSLRLTTP